MKLFLNSIKEFLYHVFNKNFNKFCKVFLKKFIILLEERMTYEKAEKKTKASFIHYVGYSCIHDKYHTNNCNNCWKPSLNEKTIKITFKNLEKNDQDYFTTLLLGSNEVEAQDKEPVWKTIVNKSNENNDTFDDLIFAGWYYDDGESSVLVCNFKEIYSDITLNAGWYNPRQIKGSCNKLINIEIPDSVTNIGSLAFSSCINTSLQVFEK